MRTAFKSKTLLVIGSSSGIAFLLSDAAAWVTGAVWNVDGAVMAGRKL